MARNRTRNDSGLPLREAKRRLRKGIKLEFGTLSLIVGPICWRRHRSTPSSTTPIAVARCWCSLGPRSTCSCRRFSPATSRDRMPTKRWLIFVCYTP
jgi:hypothetical protein